MNSPPNVTLPSRGRQSECEAIEEFLYGADTAEGLILAASFIELGEPSDRFRLAFLNDFSLT